MINLDHLLKIFNKPLIMGILNITPDSFYDGDLYIDQEKAFLHAVKLYENGAVIIDIGGESTRPGAVNISEEEEKERVIPVIERIKMHNSDIIISIDTRKANIAKMAIEAGASIVNDISGGIFDPEMKDIIKYYNPIYILMHSADTPDKMQKNPINEKEIIAVLLKYFKERLDFFSKIGISLENFIIDPGIGFGKTLKANYSVLKNISLLKRFNRPILVGASRKSLIGGIDSSDVSNRLGGSLAIALYSYINGIDMIRCHDVFETSQAISIYKTIEGTGKV